MSVFAPIQWLGRETTRILRDAAEVFALLYGALAVMVYTRTRGLRVVIQVGVSQVLFTGVHGLPLVGVAALAIFGILAAQFRSYLQPIIVMSVIVFSFIGVTVGMWILDYPLSMYVLYAIVGLAGIVVNDSLVLIDFVNQERRRGTPALEAVRIASQRVALGDV